MVEHETIRREIERLGIVVIIPTYNNEKTLTRVLDGVLQYTPHVILVNDGSTDTTPTILHQYPEIEIITSTHNQGKGMALRKGIKRARDRHFQYAITIDSDGQHYPSDIPVFVDAIAKATRPVLLIGKIGRASCRERV